MSGDVHDHAERCVESQLQSSFKRAGRRRLLSPTSHQTPLTWWFRRVTWLTPEQVIKCKHRHTERKSQISYSAEHTTPVSLMEFWITSEEENREWEREDLNSQVKNEVLTYFGEKPRHWWKDNEERYPSLAQLASSNPLNINCYPSFWDETQPYVTIRLHEFSLHLTLFFFPPPNHGQQISSRLCGVT